MSYIKHKYALVSGRKASSDRTEACDLYQALVKISVTATLAQSALALTALRTAVENGEGYLDKEATSHDDLFDSFRMSLLFWH